MAANGEIIKSFLVGLGFDVNESSLALFNRSIQSAAVRVTALYGTINGLAGGIIYAFSKISEGFEEMGYQYHIIAPSINKMIVLRQEMLKAYGAAGINIRKVIVDSLKLNLSLAKTKMAMEAIYKSVASRFFGVLTKESDAFRKKLYENMPYILNALEKLVKFVFKAFDAVTQLGLRLWSILGRVYDFFVALHDATDGWSTVILGVVAAWKLLNLSFLATPLGMLLAGLGALLALYDDFKTYKEGGKSFFDWGPAIPIIDAVARAITALVDTVFDLGLALRDVFHGNWFAAWDDLRNVTKDIASYVTNINEGMDKLARTFGGDLVNKLLDWRDNVDQSVIGRFNGTSAAAGNGNAFPSSPLGAVPNLVPTAVTASSQTSITIQGSPNADATARATAQQQMGVNRDLARNLKGATR